MEYDKVVNLVGRIIVDAFLCGVFAGVGFFSFLCGHWLVGLVSSISFFAVFLLMRDAGRELVTYAFATSVDRAEEAANEATEETIETLGFDASLEAEVFFRRIIEVFGPFVDLPEGVDASGVGFLDCDDAVLHGVIRDIGTFLEGERNKRVHYERFLWEIRRVAALAYLGGDSYSQAIEIHDYAAIRMVLNYLSGSSEYYERMYLEISSVNSGLEGFHYPSKFEHLRICDFYERLSSQ